MIVNIDPSRLEKDIPDYFAIKFDDYEALEDRTVNVTNPSVELGQLRHMFSYTDNMELIVCRDLSKLSSRRTVYRNKDQIVSGIEFTTFTGLETLNIKVRLLSDLGEMLSRLPHLRTLIVNIVAVPDAIVHNKLRVLVISQCIGVVERVECPDLRVACIEAFEMNCSHLQYLSCNKLRFATRAQAISTETLDCDTMSLISMNTTHVIARIITIDPEYFQLHLPRTRLYGDSSKCLKHFGIQDQDLLTPILRHNILMLL